MNNSNGNSFQFESYLKVKNSNANEEKTSMGYFIINVKEKTFIYKKNKESPNIISKHIDKDILNFEETTDIVDKGLCEYPFGFQIITKQKSYILFSNTILIYTRWIDSLKQLFKILRNANLTKNITPETSPDKIRNTYVNSNFKQLEKSPISTKAKLSANNNYPNNYYNNFNNDKIIGFDDDFLNAINDLDENDSRKNFSEKNYNLGNINSFEKGLKNSLNNIDSNKNSNKYDMNNNEMYITSNNNNTKTLEELNQGWDKDFKEIKKIATSTNNDKPTLNKTSELITQMSKKNNSNSKKTTAFIEQSTLSESKPIMNYKKNLSLFDENSLHIRQSANEAYFVENLHYGIEDNLNKSIDCKNSQNMNIKTANKNGWSLKKSQENEKSIDVGNSFAMKKIFENSDNSWTFKITVPVKNDK